jgi:ABC-type Na+ efflux pump permease subunit
MSGKRLILSLVAVAALLAAVPSSAAEATRETYKEAVEPICKANTEANEKILKGVRQKVKSGQYDAAAKQFQGAAKALKKTRGQLLAVPKPAEDTAKLTKWLGYVKTEVTLFESIATKLKKDEVTAAQKMVVRLVSNARQANNQVLDYEFRYCRFQPSKFI